MLRIRHVLSTGAATIVSGLLSMLVAVCAARLLDPISNGHYAQFIFVMNLMFIALNLGVGTCSTYFLASGEWSIADARRLISRFLLVVAALVAVMILVIRLTLIGGYLERLLQTPSLGIELGLGSGVLLLGIQLVVAALMGAHRYDTANLLGILRVGLPVPFMLALGLTVKGEYAVEGGQVIAVIAAFAVAWWVLSAHAVPAGDSPGPVRVRSLLRYGGLAYFSNLLHFLSLRGLLLGLSIYASPAEVGYFSLGLLLLEAMLLLPSVIGQLLLPQSSGRAFDPEFLGLVLRANIVFASIVASVALFAAEPAARLLLGPSYQAAGVVVRHLAPSVALLAAPKILSQVLTGRGYPGYPLIAAVLSVIFAGIASMWWLPSWGIRGAAWVCNGVSAMTAVVTIYGYCRIEAISVFALLTPRKRDVSMFIMRTMK